ncbi:hypothetical protein Tco_1417578 [Tanacetum coccineum]
MANDLANYYSGITSIMVNEKNAYELKGKFLDDLHKNAFSGTNGKMRLYTTKLWIYSLKELCGTTGSWGSNEIEPTNEETSDLEETNHNDEQEIGEIFRIKTNLFDYETPLCKKFKEFNYLLKINPHLLTKYIEGFKTYDEYKDDWIYEWNENVPWVHEKLWTDTGVWNELALVVYYCKPFNYKSGYSEWPTCSWKEDGYYNGGNLPRAYIVGNTLLYQDLEWYDALMDSELKDEALRNKAIMEGLINEDDESSNYGWRRWDGYEIADHDQEEREYEYEHEDEDEERCELFDDHELPVCNIRRFKMIKYSFGDDKEYVVIKEDEYDDLNSTSKDACRAYQEIFCMIDEGWMDLAERKEIDNVGGESMIWKSRSVRILELKQRYFEDYCSDDQYVVSIKEDTAYLCLLSPETTKETRPICHIQERQYAVFKLYRNKIFWKISNVVPTPRNPQYAWNESNINTIVHVLDYFHHASRLRFNMSKSKLLGISVDGDKVVQAARKIGCVTLQTPFKYLGLKVDDLMSRIQSWNETARVVKAIHGGDEKIGKKAKLTFSSLWLDIVHEVELLKDREVEGTLLIDMKDRWTWSLEGLGNFSVASVRKLLDGNMLPEWIKAMPIKAAESSRHIFFSCRIAREILHKISRWWDGSYMELSSYEEWLDWILNIRISVKHKKILEGVYYAMWWHI